MDSDQLLIWIFHLKLILDIVLGFVMPTVEFLEYLNS